ncbi:MULTISPECIES: hypothetical protein [unclassified Streptomyces]|uniref:hypothetical protein n=1 Tax=unclassified Streptomyces TaxID=2593676 RepID=UPI000DB919E7|nr:MULTISPECIES: hypothetical protein [unclassified Streptomyces]MYT73373.1 hypothetical protein [Streptomyces sp. SID8367]RAJ70591.1 hypothetical protein K377_07930 [Streptomyces sp. PsTaAH-137]
MASGVGVAVVTSQPRSHLWLIEVAGAMGRKIPKSVRHATREALHHHTGPIAFALPEVTACRTTLAEHLLAVHKQRPVVLIAPSPAVLEAIAATDQGIAHLPTFSDLPAALAS